MSLRFFSYDERPELRERNGFLRQAWPQYMLHDPIANERWHLLYERFGAFQFFLVDADDDAILAEGNSIPARLDLGDLPDRGWDEVMARATSEAAESPNVVSAIQVLVDRARHGSGLSRLMLEEMRRIAREHDFTDLVAPVRPSSKALYPLTPIDRYVTWMTAEALPFDPWLRVHARLGAEIVRVCHESMTIPGSVSEWEEWTGLAFPESGDYVVAGALEPVTVDLERDAAVYVEPNVWMRHRIRAARPLS